MKSILQVIGAIVGIFVLIAIFAPNEVEKNNDIQKNDNLKKVQTVDLAKAVLKKNLWFTCFDKYKNGTKVFNTKVFVDNSLLINGVYYPRVARNTWENKDMKFRINTLYDDTELIIDDYNQKRSVYCNFEYK